MNRILTTIVAFGLLVPTAVTSPLHTPAQQRKLSWSDEFNGPDGAPPDPAKWEIVTGGNGFGNKELEQYTERLENIHQERGNLVITARHEPFTGADGIQREYTSARLQTKGKFEQKYGRFEARIKIPQGQGMWPAFWLLGNDNDSAGWPGRGEIDIMENVGYEPGKIHGSMHGPRYSGDSPLTGAYSLPAGSKFADDFHVYAVEWDASAIRFYVMTTYTRLRRQTASPAPSAGFSIIRSSFCSTSRWADSGRKIQMRRLNSRNRCLWIMCAFTPLHSTQRICDSKKSTVVKNTNSGLMEIENEP
jgi:beta-glucanase (GH16 family)